MKNQSDIDINRNNFTFLHWVRLVFIIFSLYLMGDVFYRWDAFRFHSSFFEYIPNVALAFLIWSILSLLSSIIVWLLLKACEKVCGYAGLKIKAEHLVLYLAVFIIIASLAWISKKAIFSDIQTSLQLKLTVFACISGLAIPATWLFRNKTDLWINGIQERITPLLWLFVVCLLLSLPIVGFHMWEENKDQEISRQIPKSTVPELDKKRPNILLVTFDTLTARNMSVYGYHLPTTPFIKKWSKSASLFTRTKSESSYTAATTPSLMTGKRPWTHRKYHHDLAAKPFKSETENIALVLKENGYYNSAFIANIVTPVNALGISKSIDTAPLVIEFLSPGSIEGLIEKNLFLLFGDKFSTYNWLGQDDFLFTVLLRRIDKKVFTTEFPPKLAFNKFLEMVDNNAHEPFFAWIHVMPPHHPYAPPKPFAGTFNSSWELREKNKMNRYNPEINKYSTKGLPFPKELKEKIKVLKDYYDEFILFCDKQFEDFIGELQSKDWISNTAIILSSDHGESFEHDYFQHNPSHLYEQVTHIPLIIMEPGQTRGRIIDNIAEQIDIPATILDLANIPVPSWMEGRSLLPLMHGKELPSKTAIAVNLYMNVPTDPITKGAIAVWQDDYKLIHYLDNEKSLLFNLNKDPDELNNIFNDELETGQRLLSFINNSLEKANKKIMAEKKN